jgi:hypothetical protein
MAFEKCKGSLDQFKMIKTTFNTTTFNKFLMIIELFTRITTPSENVVANDNKMAGGFMDKQRYV